jgi:ADP-ribose pyrophosphatase YjhB (NUDIX family)
LDDLRAPMRPRQNGGGLMPFFSRFFGTVTLGVQAVIIDGQGRIFLVRHSYVPGWHLPGGGVEVGETLVAALARELAEECNIAPVETPVLHGVFLNSRISRRDHVVVYVVRRFRQDPVPQPNYEIIEHGFFHPDALPADASRATRRRLAEVLQGAAITERW